LAIAAITSAGSVRSRCVRLQAAAKSQCASCGRALKKSATVLVAARYLLAVVLLFAVQSVCAAASPSVGMVTKVENQAKIGGATAVVGSIVHVNDELTTGPCCARHRLLVGSH
jgi:hypothetical protein